MERLPPKGTKPLGKLAGPNAKRVYIITLLIGLLAGILISTLGTIVLFNLGFFDQFYYCPPSVNVQSCPPEDAKNLELTPTPTPSVTPVPSATPTPDLGATATAACATYESQFPGTPCPDSSP
ncbi:MAG: hypothetical protein P1P76_07150 [Anaerolineales bacterium]|nr:hypothetical protein [Anaerolineales bacterium]